MKDILDLLKKQNQLVEDHNKLLESSLGEFKRILKLQAAETNVMTARNAIFEELLQKVLDSVSEIEKNTEKFIDEFNS